MNSREAERLKPENPIIKALRWAAAEAWEKINIPAKWREIKATSKEWGPRFIVVAVIWELIEDGLFPLLSWYFGVPWLIPIFLIWHFEPIVYPIFFWAFRTYDRMRGKTPWEADRPAYSSHKRTAIKVMVYRVVSLGSLFALFSWAGVNPWFVTGYALMMSLFGFVHERIWHDLNFGIIIETDQVQARRVIAKSITYRTVSLLLLGGGFAATLDPTPWVAFAVYQGAMLACYLALETAWAKSTMGLTGVPTPPAEPSVTSTPQEGVVNGT